MSDHGNDLKVTAPAFFRGGEEEGEGEGGDIRCAEKDDAFGGRGGGGGGGCGVKWWIGEVREVR